MSSHPPDLRTRIRALRAIARLAAGELNRVELLEPKRNFTSAPHLLYLAFWWATVILVALLPTWSGEAVIYFGAVLALAAAWLVATPQLGAGMVSTDFAELRPGKGAWERIREAFAKERVSLPELSADQERELVDSLAKFVPHLTPIALLQLILKIALMAVKLALVGVIGLLIGPRLVEVHWWHGWSPVSALYGIAAPWALALLVSLVMPVIVQLYLAAVKLDLVSDPDGDGPPSQRT